MSKKVETNKYTVRAFDYYGFEMKDLTKTFSNFSDMKDYALEINSNNAIPFLQCDKNDQAIGLGNGRKIGADDDSRIYG